ncbi:hypothetical protein CLV98_102311 [Dyadobacter jejuensis]|uniref:Cellulase (Glycosyl hydrolase family 5) n=1 Tax=Dyadobacter jejuensis TaxID=1082580 RepID=A0A316BAA4_9BACT|nr:hypothetical protein [Dyadobacter jejuensis]PWJ59477.1 hypothetical protein CLV98_102311 [Dyadobacter jejuensis]
MIKKTLLLLLLLWAGVIQAQKRHTTVSIRSENFYINGKITLQGKSYQGMNLEGLLPNSRMVQGIFDDTNPETKHQWKYADTGEWDPDRNTREFVEAMEIWKKKGLLAFTVNLQGGSPYGYSKSQPWHNSAIRPDGTLDDAYMKRLEKILTRADQLGMVVILGYYYFGQDGRIVDDRAIEEGVKNTTNWVLDKKYENVIVEIANECNINYKTHPILQPQQTVTLIDLVKSIQRKGRRLLVSTSFSGNFIPTDEVLAASDFVLVHGNGVKQPERIEEMVKIIRDKKTYKGQPIVFNEDDHFDFDKPYNNFIAATKAHASWGYFDYRMKDEAYQDGYQSVPVDWGIDSPRKKAFFDLLQKMTQGSKH